MTGNGAPPAAAAPPAPAGPAVDLLLEAGRVDRHYWSDLWRHRELLLILAWRDVSVRYKQTVIGLSWAVLRPLVTATVFTVVFGRLARMPTEGAAPYVLVVASAILPWTLFSLVLTDASASVVDNAQLIGKVWFPRMAIPLAATANAVVEFAVTAVLLLAGALLLRFPLGPSVLLLPLLALWAYLAAIGPALWLAAVSVKYRDVRYVVPFLVQVGLYVSPVGFTAAVVPERFRLLYALNPMAGVIDGFRWCILGPANVEPFVQGMLLGLAVTLAWIWAGVHQFRKMERAFSDVI